MFLSDCTKFVKVLRRFFGCILFSLPRSIPSRYHAKVDIKVDVHNIAYFANKMFKCTILYIYKSDQPDYIYYIHIAQLPKPHTIDTWAGCSIYLFFFVFARVQQTHHHHLGRARGEHIIAHSRITFAHTPTPPPLPSSRDHSSSNNNNNKIITYPCVMHHHPWIRAHLTDNYQINTILCLYIYIYIAVYIALRASFVSRCMECVVVQCSDPTKSRV